MYVNEIVLLFIICKASLTYIFLWFSREKSRRYSEQAAAMVCLHALKVVDKTYGFVPTIGARKYQHILDDAEKNSKRGDKRESESGDETILESDNSQADSKKQKVKVEVNGGKIQQKEKMVESSLS